MLTVLDLPPLSYEPDEMFDSTIVDVPVLVEDEPFINHLGLPQIGAMSDSNAPHVAEATNPGTTNPLQQNHNRRLCIDQTMSVSASSAAVFSSNGQAQYGDKSAGQRGVTVTSSSAPVQSSDGSFQAPGQAPKDSSANQRPGGLPMESRPDSQNHAKHTVAKAISLPNTTNVMADNHKPGSLPTLHMIR